MNNDKTDRELPVGWVDTFISNLYEFEYGKGLTKQARNENGKYPVYGSNGVVGFHDDFYVKGPVIIVGRKGAAGEVKLSESNCWPIDTTYYIKVSKLLSIKFSYFLLRSLRLSQFEKSTAIPGLNRNDAYSVKIKIPSRNEQHRIVAKIEELFSDLDAGIESLEKARAQLKIYRQAVLKYAFEGKLTEEWRKQHAHTLEPAEQLLKKIKEKREKLYNTKLEEWEKKVKEWQNNGKEGKKPLKPKVAKISSYTESYNLGIPSEWTSSNLHSVCSDIVDCPHSTPKWSNKGKICLRTTNFFPNRLDVSDVRYVSDETYHERIERLKPKKK